MRAAVGGIVRQPFDLLSRFTFESVSSIEAASSRIAFDSSSIASFSSCERAARSAKFFAEDSDIGNLSHEETRRLRTAGFVGSRGMSYETRDCSNDSRKRLTNIPAERPANSGRDI
jgi:hypothetical protein